MRERPRSFWCVLQREIENRLISGDKRFFRALKADCPELFKQLRPSLISFERCLIAVCESKGFAAVHERLRVAKGCDTTLRSALGTDGKEFLQALKSYDPLSNI
ncbi:hypothetical protein CCP2SC5_1710003 [Azospirillaceae bacterium]